LLFLPGARAPATFTCCGAIARWLYSGAAVFRRADPRLGNSLKRQIAVEHPVRRFIEYYFPVVLVPVLSHVLALMGHWRAQADVCGSSVGCFGGVEGGARATVEVAVQRSALLVVKAALAVVEGRATAVRSLPVLCEACRGAPCVPDALATIALREMLSAGCVVALGVFRARASPLDFESDVCVVGAVRASACVPVRCGAGSHVGGGGRACVAVVTRGHFLRVTKEGRPLRGAHFLVPRPLFFL
jgi:hypothetical protein